MNLFLKTSVTVFFLFIAALTANASPTLRYYNAGTLSDWTEEGINGKLTALIEEMGVKNGVVLFPLRAAVSGKQVTPGGGTEIALIIGKEETLRRLDSEIEFLSNL